MMNRLKKTSRKYLASDKLSLQIWGAILKKWWLLLLLVIMNLAPMVQQLLLGHEVIINHYYENIIKNPWNPWYILALVTLIIYMIAMMCYSLSKIYSRRNSIKGITICHLIILIMLGVWIVSSIFILRLYNHIYWMFFLTIFVALAISVCNSLTQIYNIYKAEIGITWCQISVLVFIGIWIIGFLVIFDIDKESPYFIVIGIVGTLLIWVFQDKVKGAAAFVHLRVNHLLNIGDWINVPKYNVDGLVSKVTLTTVTIDNWDTTNSSIPISSLQEDHFINLQKMVEGKTYGRRMYMKFNFDANCFHPLSSDEVHKLKNMGEIICYIPSDEIKVGMLNAQLYRQYIFHWLMNHPHVSQQPRLIVRWMEQRVAGMPLQVYAYIMDSNFAAFERQQSLIVEYILLSMQWFGLRLFQMTSGCYINNETIHTTHMKKNKGGR